MLTLPAKSGGTDLTKKTYTRTSTADPGEQANTWLNVTGSGWFTGIYGDTASSSGILTIAITVDGGTRVGYQIFARGSFMPLFMRFTSSLLVTVSAATGNNNQAWILLD